MVKLVNWEALKGIALAYVGYYQARLVNPQIKIKEDVEPLITLPESSLLAAIPRPSLRFGDATVTNSSSTYTYPSGYTLFAISFCLEIPLRGYKFYELEGEISYKTQRFYGPNDSLTRNELDSLN